MNLSKLWIPLTIVLFAWIAVGWGPNTQKAAGDTESNSSTRLLPRERPIAFVRRFKPLVNVFNRAEDLFKKVDKAEKLYDGDTLATRKNGYAAVQFMDKSLAKVKPNSLLLINGSVDNDTESASTRIMMNAGELLLDVVEQTRSDFEVATSTSVATVKGTTFGANIEEGGSTYYYVLDGSVEVTATESGNTESINRSMYARVDAAGEEVETGKLDDEEMQQKEEEFQQMDKKMTPEKLKLRFRNESGELREIELYYYENEQ